MKRGVNWPLKQAIVASRHKQYVVARRAQLDDTVLSAFVNGRRRPQAIHRARLARVLGKPEADLFPETP
jgi:transcriptional regulator with XRE-family HTH domain